MSIQFSATPEEVFALVEWAAKECHMELGAMEFPPEKYFRVSIAEISALKNRPNLKKLILFRTQSGPSVELETQALNDAIVVFLSWPKNSTLRQSVISVAGRAVQTLAAWKTISRQLRKVTKSGVTAINRSTGATTNLKAFRFSEGARELAAQGTTMLPLAGGTELIFDAKGAMPGDHTHDKHRK